VSRSLRERDPYPLPRNVAVISWTGMRGVISLAAALALPLTTEAGTPFPGRDLVIFLTFCVILTTLVVQGLSLPVLIRALSLEDDGTAEREEIKGRIKVAQAALNRIDELAREEWAREYTAERMRGLYNYRRTRFVARFDGDDEDGRPPLGGTGASLDDLAEPWRGAPRPDGRGRLQSGLGPGWNGRTGRRRRYGTAGGCPGGGLPPLGGLG
jgi:hypothetical protein